MRLVPHTHSLSLFSLSEEGPSVQSMDPPRVAFDLRTRCATAVGKRLRLARGTSARDRQKRPRRFAIADAVLVRCSLGFIRVHHSSNGDQYNTNEGLNGGLRLS